jgi:MerR family regulatory protein
MFRSHGVKPCLISHARALAASLSPVLSYGIKEKFKITKGLMIGKIAKLARVNVETIRYYQRRGLLTEPD